MRNPILLTLLLTIFGCGQNPSARFAAPQRELRLTAETDPAAAETFTFLRKPQVPAAAPETKRERAVAVEAPLARLVLQMPVTAPIVVSYFYGPRIMTSLEYSLKLESENDGVAIALPNKLHLSQASFFKKYGQFHSGIDFSVPQDTEVHATADGQIFSQGYMRCVGNTVTIRHFDPASGAVLFSIYEHLTQNESSPKWSDGQSVKAGQVIGLSGHSGSPVSYSAAGKSGCVAGNHLHFELRLAESSAVFSGQPMTAKQKFAALYKHTARVNPADYIGAIDQLCQRRKTLELNNVQKLLSLGTGAIAPLTAGRCGQLFEKSITLALAQRYQRK